MEIYHSSMQIIMKTNDIIVNDNTYKEKDSGDSSISI